MDRDELTQSGTQPCDYSDRIKNSNPQICLKCTGWLRGMTCHLCGHRPNSSELTFHELCRSVQSDSRLWPYVIPAKISPLAPAQLPDVRGVVSAFVLGTLAGQTLEATRTWLLSRCEEFRRTFGHGYDYQRLVEGVEDFLMKQPDAGGIGSHLSKGGETRYSRLWRENVPDDFG